MDWQAHLPAKPRQTHTETRSYTCTSWNSRKWKEDVSWHADDMEGVSWPLRLLYLASQLRITILIWCWAKWHRLSVMLRYCLLSCTLHVDPTSCRNCSISCLGKLKSQHCSDFLLFRNGTFLFLIHYWFCLFAFRRIHKQSLSRVGGRLIQ